MMPLRVPSPHDMTSGKNRKRNSKRLFSLPPPPHSKTSCKHPLTGQRHAKARNYSICHYQASWYCIPRQVASINLQDKFLSHQTCGSVQAYEGQQLSGKQMPRNDILISKKGTAKGVFSQKDAWNTRQLLNLGLRKNRNGLTEEAG